MSEEFILVKISKFTIITARMAFVTFIIGISNAFMSGESRAGITTALVRENLQIVSANLTVKQFVNLSDVLFKLVKLNERRVITMRTSILQQSVEALLNVKIGKGNAEFFLVETGAKFTVQV